MTMAGRLGYTEREFWAMSPRFFYAACAGYVLNQREQWNLARHGWYYAVLPYQDDKKTLEVTDVAVFEWERERVEAERAAKKKERQDLLKNAWGDWMKELEAKNAQHELSKT